MSEQTVTREKAPRNVDYALEVVDDLPEPIVHRRSPLEDNLDSIKAAEQMHGKWVKIGEYENATASGAAANVLRQRHGNSATIEGWTIQSKRFNKQLEDGSTVPKTGLFARYTPDQIVDGARAEWDRKEAERLAAIEKARVEREKAKGNGSDKAKAETPKAAAKK